VDVGDAVVNDGGEDERRLLAGLLLVPQPVGHRFHQTRDIVPVRALVHDLAGQPVHDQGNAIPPLALVMGLEVLVLISAENLHGRRAQFLEELRCDLQGVLGQPRRWFSCDLPLTSTTMAGARSPAEPGRCG
jgi:hypothetical protein